MESPEGPADLNQLASHLVLLRDALVLMAQGLRDIQADMDVEGQQQAQAAVDDLLRKVTPR